MRKLFALIVLLACQTSFSAESFCDKHSGSWWQSGYKAWIMVDYSFLNDCKEITEAKTTSIDGNSKFDSTTYAVTSDWTFIDRWKAEADQEWYSLYTWIYWNQNELITRSHLYRDRDKQLAWDFTNVKAFKQSEMIETITRIFPIEEHIYKVQFLWTRKRP